MKLFEFLKDKMAISCILIFLLFLSLSIKKVLLIQTVGLTYMKLFYQSLSHSYHLCAHFLVFPLGFNAILERRLCGHCSWREYQ